MSSATTLASAHQARAQVAPVVEAKALSIVCFSGEWDKLFAAFTIANGALAMGREVHVFVTFWATAAFDCSPTSSWSARIKRWLVGAGADQAPLSKHNYLGLGRRLLARKMRRNGVASLSALIAQAQELGVHLYFCDMSMRLLSYDPPKLAEGSAAKLCGVATFLSVTEESQQTLFI